MKAIALTLWNNPTACAGALHIANVTWAAEGRPPLLVNVLIAAIVTAGNWGVVKPVKRRR